VRLGFIEARRSVVARLDREHGRTARSAIKFAWPTIAGKALARHVRMPALLDDPDMSGRLIVLAAAVDRLRSTDGQNISAAFRARLGRPLTGRDVCFAG
jgi:hypothetical protein